MGGGGLNCEAKAQVLVVTPPPPLFPESRSQRGGVTAEQYGTCVIPSCTIYVRSSENTEQAHGVNIIITCMYFSVTSLLAHTSMEGRL